MIRLCPRGQENNNMFNYLFLNKLPRELRVPLSGADGHLGTYDWVPLSPHYFETAPAGLKLNEMSSYLKYK
jgi:hypothetical protein